MAAANPVPERVIGSIRRECLDHYVGYDMNTRTHLSLDKDSPTSRPATPLSTGRIVDIPQVNGLHHPTTAQRRSDGAESPSFGC